MIRAIIFDLNKVLVTFKECKSYEKELGISQKEFWRPREEFLDQYNLNEINLNSFFLNIMKKSNIPGGKLQVVKKLHEEGLKLVPGAIQILERLSKYDLILMAGEGKESLDLKLDKFKLRKYFNKIYATCYQKLRKTDPNFYKLILDENNLKPDETIFIDDRINYIKTAKEIGINSILFTDINQLKKEISILL